MKTARTIAVVSFLLFALSKFVSASEDSCIAELSNSYSDDSTAFSFNLDEYRLRNYGKDYLAFSIKVIRVLLAEHDCTRADINFGRSAFGRAKSRCSLIASGRDSSRVCYVESNLGYFYVTKDYLSTVHIIYNRWD